MKISDHFFKVQPILHFSLLVLSLCVLLFVVVVVVNVIYFTFLFTFTGLCTGNMGVHYSTFSHSCAPLP